MYTIIMDKHKNLVTTVRSMIYKGENLADKIQFLVPPKYGGNMGRTVTNTETGETETIIDGTIDLADYTAILKYVDPGGNFHSEVLARDEDMYKNYYRYSLPVKTDLTGLAGEITLRLSFTYFDHVTETLEKLESNSTTLRVDKPLGFDDFVSFEDEAAYRAELSRLARAMPDDVAIDDQDMLHLTHEGEAIGAGVEVIVPTVPDNTDGAKDGVIDVDNIDRSGQGTPIYQFIEV